MTLEQEQQLVLNPVHGASLVWRAAKTYSDESKANRGLPLNLSMLVLPLVLHQPSADSITRANKASGIARVLIYDRTIRAQLDERIRCFADLTWKSLLVGQAAQLLQVASTERGFEIFPGLNRQSLPRAVSPLRANLQSMLGAADRLGFWFYHENQLTLTEILQVAV